MCAAVSLIRLTPFTETLASGPTGTSAPSETARSSASVLDYLDAMVRKIISVSNDGYLPQAKPLLTVFQKFKLWYSHKRDVCINKNECFVSSEQGPLYSVFGNDPDPALATSESTGNVTVTVSTDVEAAKTGQSTAWQSEDTEQNKDQNPVAGEGPPQKAPAVTPGLLNGSYQESAELAFDPATYANTDWTDPAMDFEWMKDFDTYMMDDDDSWLSLVLL